MLKIGRTSADTTSYVLAQEVEFVFTNHLFSPEREKLGFRVFGRRDTPRSTASSSCRWIRRSPTSRSSPARTSAFRAEAFVSYKVPTRTCCRRTSPSTSSSAQHGRRAVRCTAARSRRSAATRS